MSNYQEKEKINVRKEALSNAIKYLTEDRTKTTIATKTYLKEAKEALIKKSNNGGNYGEIAHKLTNYYNTDYFYGTSALDTGIKGFEGKILKKRKNDNRN